METQEKLLPQQAGWIEVFLREFPQGKRWSGWKAQSNIDALGVEQRNGGAGPRIFLAFEPAPIPFAKPQKKRFDVLAGAQGVDGKVRARAVGRPLLVRTGGYPAWVLRPGDGDDEEPAAVLGAEFQKWFGSPRVANVTP
jgi:hypothetical protein